MIDALVWFLSIVGLLSLCVGAVALFLFLCLMCRGLAHVYKTYQPPSARAQAEKKKQPNFKVVK